MMADDPLWHKSPATYALILRLLIAGMSHGEIAKVAKVTRRTVDAIAAGAGGRSDA